MTTLKTELSLLSLVVSSKKNLAIYIQNQPSTNALILSFFLSFFQLAEEVLLVRKYNLLVVL